LTELCWNFPYPSQRVPVFGRNVVATSQPLAAEAGIATLRAGGNAVDAAIAMAATLTVVEPNMNGLGSDAFAIVWDGEALHGLNASGRAPAAWSPERFAGLDKMPTRGWDTVTVPGAVSAWVALAGRFGRLPLGRLFEPAIHYARNGFRVTPISAANWAQQAEELAAWPDYAAAFMPDGRAPAAGERFAFPAQARTLEAIAATNGEAFYRGALAERIAAHAAATGGALTRADLEAHQADWVTPMSQGYREFALHEIPPNGQGLAALIALGILERLDVAKHPVDSPDSLHLQIEAMKLGFADVYRYVADPRDMDVDAAALLAPDYLAARAALVDPKRAQYHPCGMPTQGGTVYLTAADAAGMMISFIQSNYMGFGSGIVVPDTGISLQNRGAGFRLEAGHPNRVAGRKRPFHTIIPAFVTRHGRPFMSFGVMGGVMQPQGHLQVLVRIADYGQNPQAASDAPRWYLNPALDLVFEHGHSPAVMDELASRGHRIVPHLPQFGYGGAQIILRLDDDAYCAGSDHRKDGVALAFG
jgi:gamma-glutamyltranspeptidase / glutathione hydrolase